MGYDTGHERSLGFLYSSYQMTDIRGSPWAYGPGPVTAGRITLANMLSTIAKLCLGWQPRHPHAPTHSHTNITHNSSGPLIATNGLVAHAGAWIIDAPCSRGYHAIDYPSPIYPSPSHNWRLPNGKHSHLFTDGLTDEIRAFFGNKGVGLMVMVK